MSDTAVRTRRPSKTLCTRHVSINLHKRTGVWSEAWQSFSLDNLEDFTKQAKAYLGDKTNLKGSTIDGADYEELLTWFREQAEWKPKVAKKERSTVVKAARAALADVRMENPRATRHTAKTVAAKVAAPETVTESIPERPKRPVPQNWLDHAKDADTAAARKWWAELCERCARGEDVPLPPIMKG